MTDSAQDFVQNMKSQHLECRTIGHRWSVTALENAEGQELCLMSWACRCGTTKVELVSLRDGTVLKRSMNYTGAGGYLAKDLDEKIHRGQFRLETIKRLRSKT